MGRYSSFSFEVARSDQNVKVVYGLRPENKGCWYHLAGKNVLVIFMKFNLIQNKVRTTDISKVGLRDF